MGPCSCAGEGQDFQNIKLVNSTSFNQRICVIIFKAKGMNILGIITIIGFLIAIAALFFTEQGQEIIENIRYHITRNFKRIKNPQKNINTDNDGSDTIIPKKESRFVRDLSIIDGSTVKIGQKFTKIWEIENIGDKPWENRFLEREGPCEGPGRLKSRKRVRIPYTHPGQRCQIKINLIAPDQPGSCYATWKMVDEKGKILLPHQKPVFVSVDVTE